MIVVWLIMHQYYLLLLSWFMSQVGLLLLSVGNVKQCASLGLTKRLSSPVRPRFIFSCRYGSFQGSQYRNVNGHRIIKYYRDNRQFGTQHRLTARRTAARTSFYLTFQMHWQTASHCVVLDWRSGQVRRGGRPASGW